MITDRQCAQLCIDQYNGGTGFDGQYGQGGDFCSLKYYPDCTAVVHEGSHNMPNWINNFDAIMMQTSVGGVEAGFYINLPQILAALISSIPTNKPVVITGHSRGAARAHIFAAMLIKQGYTVEVVTFGSPRPGDAALAAILANAPNRSYYNFGHIDDQDYVCDCPLDLELVEPFVHPAGRIQIDIPPQPNDPWLLLARHHIELYYEGTPT